MVTTRLQVTLEPEQHRRAKSRAAKLGISLAEFVRRSLDRALDETARSRPDISAIFGLGDSGGSNVAMHEDAYVAEAIEFHLEQRRR